MTSKKKDDLDETNFRQAAQKAVGKHGDEGQIVAMLVWGRIVGLYEKGYQLLDRITEVVKKERATETEGSDENTEQDLEAYDQIVELVEEHKPWCKACSIELELGTKENPHPIPRRYHTCKGVDREPIETSWEEAFKNAGHDLEFAYKAIDDVAGWSGASGNWPLQDAELVVRYALDLFKDKDAEYIHLLPHNNEETRFVLQDIVDTMGGKVYEGNDKATRALVQLVEHMKYLLGKNG